VGHFNDLRVLVVEDEPLIALDVADLLRDSGCNVAGPFRSVSAALDSMAQECPAAAVLDVNLGAETAVPIADALSAKGVPFVWLTGYPSSILPERHRERLLVAKPFSAAALLNALTGTSGPLEFTEHAA